MVENHGLDVDKGSHPGLLTVTEQLVTYSRVLLACRPHGLRKMTALADHPGQELPCPTRGRNS
jgi:hypothetical protein